MPEIRFRFPKTNRLMVPRSGMTYFLLLFGKIPEKQIRRTTSRKAYIRCCFGTLKGTWWLRKGGAVRSVVWKNYSNYLNCLLCFCMYLWYSNGLSEQQPTAVAPSSSLRHLVRVNVTLFSVKCSENASGAIFFKFDFIANYSQRQFFF